MKRILLTFVSILIAVSICAGCSSSAGGPSATGTSAAGTSTTGAAATATGTGSANAASSQCPSSASGFAKTKFLLHAGLGFGAFHRYIYKPYQAGTFRSGAHGRLRAFVKAGVAALFVKREVRLAYAASKNSPALCKVVATPLQKIGTLIQGAVSKLKGGDTSGISAVQGAVSSVESQSAGKGAAITEDQNASI